MCEAQKNKDKNVVIDFKVGVILDLNSTVGRIGMSCLTMALDDFYSLHQNYTTRIVLCVQNSTEVIEAAASGLHLLKNENVDAIIGPQNSGQANFVINLGDKAHVPIISFSATSPSLTTKTRYFVQTAVSDEAQVTIIAAILKNFEWNQVVIIYEDSDYGIGITSYLSNEFHDVDARIAYRSVIPVSASDDFLHIELLKMMTMQTRVFVVHLGKSLASRLLLKAKEIGMMDNDYVWIVSSGLMDLFASLDSRVMDAMHGVVGVKPLFQKSEKYDAFITRWEKRFLEENPNIKQANMSMYGLWAYDTLWALATAAEKVGIRDDWTTPPVNSTITNPFTFGESKVGPELLNAILETRFDGVSGKFNLENGKLTQPPFQILNVVDRNEIEVGILEVNYKNKSKEVIIKSIIWPGNSTIIPKGWEIPVNGRKLIVGIPSNPGFNEFCKIERHPRTNATQFSGYYVDLFNLVMRSLPYAVRYEFVQYEDSSYDSLIQQVFLQKYDAVVGDITITANRSNYVDFTLPFAEGGFIAIVPIKYKTSKNSWDFWDPLEEKVWFTSLGLLIFTGFAICILEHRVNNHFRGPLSDQIGKLLYFPFMTIAFAHREKIVGNLTRIVVMVWIFVVLILTSMYTASLSSTLTVTRPEPSINNVTTLIKAGSYVGCRDVSFIYKHLIQIGFNESKIRPCKSHSHCNELLSRGPENGGFSAFFGVVPYIKLFLSTYSDKYMVINPIYRTDGYAYAFPRGSPYVADVSRAITDLTEDGKIFEIEQQWSNLTYMGPSLNVNSTEITLKRFGGLFGITGSVTVSCLVIFFANFIYENKDFITSTLRSSTSIWTKICDLWSHFDEMEEAFSRRSSRDDSTTPDQSPRLPTQGSQRQYFNTFPYTRRSSRVTPVVINDP